MRGLRFVRCAAVAATVAAGWAVSAAPVAAAPPIHVVTHYMGANINYDLTAPGQVGSAYLWVQLVDQATGEGSLTFWQVVEGLDAEGNRTGPIMGRWADGTVQVEVDEHLRTAHAWGSIALRTCEYSWDPDCNSPVMSQSYLDATWTATTGAARTHSVMVGSVSRVSRTIFHVGATQAFADAVVLIDGESIGQADYPTQGDIYDARYSTAEMYYGGDLPGKVKPVPAGSGVRGHRAVPSPNGGPTEWPLGTTVTMTTDRAEAYWNESDGGVSTWRSLNAAYETIKMRNLTNVQNSAYYYEDVWGYSGELQSITATGSGDLGVAGSLAGGSFTGTLDASVCTFISPWQQVCLDGVPLPVDMTWTASGPVERTMSNQHNNGGGESLTMFRRDDRCPAVASGTVGEATLPPSESGMIEHTLYRSDFYI